MTTNDLIGLAASYIYAIALIGLAELLRRAAGVPQELTRKLVHVGAGMWVFGVLALFDHWQWGVLPFATFILGNYLFYRYRLFRSMDEGDSTPGTVYFAIAITLLFGIFWRPASAGDHAPIAAAGAMALTWGDATAALVGRRYGQHRYTIAGETRSWEGSIAMLAAAGLAMYLALTLLPGSALAPLAPRPSPAAALLASLAGAAAATLVEAVSPRGTDNLSVPLVAAAIAWLVLGLAP
jgi:phytol kinase